MLRSYGDAVRDLSSQGNQASFMTAGNRFHSGHALARVSDMSAEQLFVVGEYAALIASTRDGDVKLFAMNGGQRARRGDNEDAIDGFSLGGV